MDVNQVNHQKNSKIAAFLALLGALQPTPIPFAGIHKLYLGQYGWGAVYMLLGMTPVPRVACAAESLWYLVSGAASFEKFWSTVTPPSATNVGLTQTVETVAHSIREIEQLRQEGLLSEYEFEQKRRSLLEHIP